MSEKSKPAPSSARADKSGEFLHSRNKDLLGLLQKNDVQIDRLSDGLGIPQQTIKDWCNGIGVPNSHQAIKMAELIPCDLYELYLAILRTRR